MHYFFSMKSKLLSLTVPLLHGWFVWSLSGWFASHVLSTGVVNLFHWVCKLPGTAAWMRYVVFDAAKYTPVACYVKALVVLNFVGKHKNIFTFSVISQHCNGTGCWKHSLWKTRTRLFSLVNIMVADDLLHKEPGHWHSWYLPSSSRIYWYQRLKGYAILRAKDILELAVCFIIIHDPISKTILPHG